ncbi:MAG: hypothetical protein AABY22_05210 [Nanoarchaeota archaeon]
MIDEIILKIKKRVEMKESISPIEWLDYASQLNTLRSDDDDKLWEIGQSVAQEKQTFIEQGFSVAKATAMIQATNKYREFHQLQAKMDRITEEIRLSKIRARASQDEYWGQR